jgi:hypothetical protein
MVKKQLKTTINSRLLTEPLLTWGILVFFPYHLHTWDCTTQQLGCPTFPTSVDIENNFPQLKDSYKTVFITTYYFAMWLLHNFIYATSYCWNSVCFLTFCCHK